MKPVKIVGILNTTPDSYFDGGKHTSLVSALERARKMIEEGVDIIEVGGESTGPNSKDVPLEEELARTIPIITEIAKVYPTVSVSIDTYKSEVARQAIKTGVKIVNDITAGRGDSEMFAVCAQQKVSIILMFAKDATPRTTIHPTQYDNVIQTIKDFLFERKMAAEAAGIASDHILLDPGLGHFVSSDPLYSFAILAHLKEFLDLGCPLFISPSRKSFLAGKDNLKTADRLPGTIAASVVAVLNGAEYIRTHDVLEVKQACEVAEEIFEAQK